VRPKKEKASEREAGGSAHASKRANETVRTRERKKKKKKIQGENWRKEYS